jgi:hypothetical protein
MVLVFRILTAILVGICAALITSPANAASAYDECLLASLRGARNAAASELIQRSCFALYRNGEMLLPREMAYHRCILGTLPGMKELSAIAQVVAICSRQRSM